MFLLFVLDVGTLPNRLYLKGKYMEEKVILVDQQDSIVGESEKMHAHEKGLLHRAFSILIFNSKKEQLAL